METVDRTVAQSQSLSREQAENIANQINNARNDDTEEEDDDDCVEEVDEAFFEAMVQTRKSQRGSVSAACINVNNFNKVVFHKSAEQRAILTNGLSHIFMFSCLETNSMSAVIDAFEEFNVAGGTEIITQGAEGDFLYFIESGTVSCFKAGLEPEQPEQWLCTCEAGAYFGELALLYTCPRAATVRTETDCKLWKLDQDSFNHLVKIGMIEQRNMRETFLSQVEILSALDTFERSNIVDALKVEWFDMGADILLQGDAQNVQHFYLLEEGTAAAYKDGEEVAVYQPGDYFGELALLMDAPRQCTIRITSPGAKVLSLERRTFDRMVGSLRDLMITRARDKYSGWTNQCA